MCYNYKEKNWYELNDVDNDCIRSGKLVVSDNFIYNVSEKCITCYLEHFHINILSS